MIARKESYVDKLDIWAKLAAAVPECAIEWRQDGKIGNRDGRFFARFVPFISAQFVRERLDEVVPGEWDLSLELLPPMPGAASGPTGAPPRPTLSPVIAAMTRSWPSSSGRKRAAVRR